VRERAGVGARKRASRLCDCAVSGDSGSKREEQSAHDRGSEREGMLFACMGISLKRNFVYRYDDVCCHCRVFSNIGEYLKIETLLFLN